MRCGNCDQLVGRRAFNGVDLLYCAGCRSFWAGADVLARVDAHRRKPPASSVVSLTYEPNGTDHDDLVLRADTWAQRSDSYYYALDHPPGRASDTRASIRALLLGWRAAVEACAPGQEAWLPHGFWDQGSEWLRCRRHADAFEVVDGGSEIEGWSFDPSDFDKAARRLEDYEPHPDFGEPISVPRWKLLQDIEASLAALAPGEGPAQ